MIGIALGIALLQPASKAVVLFRGADIGAGPAYWSVEDTSLLSQEPDAPMGGQYTLTGGPGKTVLIRFGDLRRAVGPNKVIVQARLELTSLEKEPPRLRSISALQAPWGEGPSKSLAVAEAKPGETVPVVRWASTWRHRRTGENPIAWQQLGAQGIADAKPIAAAKATFDANGTLSIGGLAEAVQRQYERPDECNGFALAFDNLATFNSSESAQGQPRLVLEMQDTAPPRGGDLAVTRIEQTVGEQGEAVYTAHVKNVGDAVSSPFGVRWIVRESPGTIIELGKSLKPGEEITLTTSKTYRPNPLDHRLQPIALRVEPSGPDARPSNNSLTTYEDAFPLDFVLEKGFADRLGDDPEVWVQEQLRFLNEVAFERSRFSFALDGCLERVRAASISIVGDGTARVKAGTVLLQAGETGDPAVLMLKKTLMAMGLPDFSTHCGPVELDGVLRHRTDAYAGISGWGDTRNESMLTASLSLKPVPVFDAYAELMNITPTRLLSATEVGTLNAMLQTKQKRETVWTLNLPRVVFINALDIIGRPIGNAELSFFQMKDGRFDLGAPAFSVATSAQGSAKLPSNLTDGLGTPSPFGTLDPSGSNGSFLVRAKKHGVVEWAWLNAWQLADAAYRGQKALHLAELRFNLPSDVLESETNLAIGRIVVDSAGRLPAQLSALVDGDARTAVALPSNAGDWIEIDLGRDRTIGEISVTSGGKFWRQFDILVYATGSGVRDAQYWYREVNWPWTAQNRGIPAEKGHTVSYRGNSLMIRFIRIVCRSSEREATAAELRVVPVKVNP